MYVIENMRLNRFERKPIVSNRALFMAKGNCSVVTTSKATAECFDEPSILGASKTKVLGLGEEVAKASYKHYKGLDTPELKKSQSDL